MAEIHIPFVKGQHNEVDGKLLPQGLFVSVSNVRYERDARLGMRHALQKDNTSGAPDPNAVRAMIPFRKKHIVSINTSNPPQAVRYANGFYTQVMASPVAANVSAGIAGTLGVPRVSRVQANGSSNAFQSTDICAVGQRLFVSYCAASPPVHVMLDLATGAQLLNLTLPDNPLMAKWAVISGVPVLFYVRNSSNAIQFASFNATIGSPIATGTCVTAFTGRAIYFDVSAGGSAAEAYLAYQSAANTVTFGTVDSGGVFTLLSTVTTTASENRCAISPAGVNPTIDVVLAVIDGATTYVGDLKRALFRRGTGFIAAFAAVTSTNRISGYPVAGPHPNATYNYMIAANQAAGANGNDYSVQIYAGGTAVVDIVDNMYLISKPFSQQGWAYCFCGDVDLATATPGASYAIALPPRLNSQAIMAETVILDGVSQQVKTTAAVPPDPRRQFATVAALDADPNLTAVIGSLPFASSLTVGYALVRIESGPFAPSFQAAQLNGETVLSGPRIMRYDGQAVLDVDFAETPLITSSAQGVGGSLTAASTYQYVVVWEWTDVLGYRHRSKPSLPITITLTAGNQSTTIWITTPQITGKINGNSTSDIFAVVYRTLAGGTIFYQATIVAGGPGGTVVTDALPDTSIRVNQVLYTQGARGGLSGIQENDSPPPAQWCCAGSNRVLLGGMDNRAQLQWSKLQFAGEPISWTNNAPWRAVLDADITGVTHLDGTWIAFTSSSIWTITGDGPDDTGAGSFAPPTRLPSDIGCIDGKSIILTGEGVFFQGALDRLYLLPRGGGAPVWIGQPVRDTLALFPYISATAFDQDSSLVYFACTDTAGASGRLLIYDIRIREWYVDSFFARAIKALAIYDGLLVVDGSIIESTTSYQDTDGSSTSNVQGQVTTGDIRPFGALGWGRIRRIQILGETRDQTNGWILSLDVSYDSGRNFTDGAFWSNFNIATSLGDTIDGADHMLTQPRCDGVRVRLTISSGAPGGSATMVLNGLSMEIYQAAGLKRQPNTMRSP